MKKILYLSLLILTICTTGCTKEKDVVNSNSELASAKKYMMQNLDNYSYDVKITAKTGFIDVSTDMTCKDDLKNQITYCSSSTYGVETEEYIDYKNQMTYSKVTVPFGGDSSNGKWTSNKYSGGNSNSWIGLSDYVFDLKSENRDGGTYYTGTINSKKLANAMSQADSNINVSNIVSNDINITVYVNSNNYIEKMTFTMEIMGIQEYVEIIYKGFDLTGNLSIPEEVR